MDEVLREWKLGRNPGCLSEVGRRTLRHRITLSRDKHGLHHLTTFAIAFIIVNHGTDATEFEGLMPDAKTQVARGFQRFGF